MNCTSKVGYSLQPAKVQFFMIQYTLHFQRIQTITASFESAYAAGEPHIGKAVSEHLNAPKQFEFKEAESCGIQNPAYANRLSWLL